MFRFCFKHLRLVLVAVVASAGLITLGHSAASAASSHHFRFVAVSAVGTSQDHIIFTGNGEFDAFSALGGGSYTEFKSTGSPPFPVLSAGTWHVTQFQSFALVGTYGDLESGVLTVKIVLIRNMPSSLTIPAMLRVFCDIGAANLSTGQPEGIQLALPSRTFTQSMPATTSFSLTPE